LIFVLSYCLFAAVLAWFNFRLISNNKRIYHALNGTLHISAAGIAYYLYGWREATALLCLVRVIFDTTLNIFRGLGAGYISGDPHSIIDKIEGKFIEIIATALYWNKKYVSENDLERVAIIFRVIILVVGILLLL
jgi:hypothetical protein